MFCKWCKTEVDIAQFKLSRHTGSPCGRCYKCRRSYEDSRNKKRGVIKRAPRRQDSRLLECTKCREMLDLTMFRPHYKTKKPSSWCLPCLRDSGNNLRRSRGSPKRKLSVIVGDTKLCVRCNNMIPLTMFNINKRGLGGRVSYCKPCNKEFHSDFYRANIDLYRSRSYKWREENSEQFKAQHRIHQFNRNKQIKASKDGSVTTEFVKRVYSTKFCYYCKLPTLPEERTLEHKQPLSRGGSHSTANIEMSCFKCNSSKRALTEDEFFN